MLTPLLPQMRQSSSRALAALSGALCGLGVALLLAGCSGNARAPVEDRAARPLPAPAVPTRTTRNLYSVQRGETLYSIAFRYGMDFRKVAAANRIPPPYTIYPGQSIELREAALPEPAPTPVPAARSPQPATPAAAPAKPAPASTPVAAAPAVAKPRAAPAATGGAYMGAPVRTWLWPASGRVTRGYSRSVHKGIDIGGRRGDPVMAVAAGKVVYAGTGIVGLGELLIIKHNDLYLSAYAHNDRLLVHEGQVVAAGDRIAEKGSSGTDSVKLHFEIRKEGKPVDPQRLLPPRR
ncbi:MAG: peptidoglycan DD-metalloendopeptidase family protein [Halioglobus sp.]|nr:peptidoglycan DD-metalloendopeptidase family protein [Halioglobus sp.]